MRDLFPGYYRPTKEQFVQMWQEPGRDMVIYGSASIVRTLTSLGLIDEYQLSIKAPTLLIIGDSNVVRPEHAVELFRLLGGGVAGDLVGLPRSLLAVLPGTTHVTLVDRAEWLVSMIDAFLDTPMPFAK